MRPQVFRWCETLILLKSVAKLSPWVATGVHLCEPLFWEQRINHPRALGYRNSSELGISSQMPKGRLQESVIVISTHSTLEKCLNKQRFSNSRLLLCFLPVQCLISHPGFANTAPCASPSSYHSPLLPRVLPVLTHSRWKSKFCPCHGYQMKTLTSSSAIVIQSVNPRL